MTVLGAKLRIGDNAPDFTVLANDFTPVHGSDFSGKIRLISVVPSLETSVCDAQTRRFNEEAAKMDPDVVILTISADHPITQKRWCGAAGIDQVQVLSDHLEMSFGAAYGTWLKERRLEQRSIFVVNKDDKITYTEYIPVVGQHPDYDAALAAVRALL
ncbi:MAG: thiol peroxidase [Candidatus Promineifilaceae bacterium]